MLDSIRPTSSRHGARFALVVVLALFSACVPVLGIDEPELAADTPCKKYVCENGSCGYQATNAGEPCGTKKVCDGVGECKGDTGAACANGSECISGGCFETCLVRNGDACANDMHCASGVCAGMKCVAQSCIGLNQTCGPNGDEHCCNSLFVMGGSFNRSNDPLAPATVSDFRLDRFEVTVARFRKFVQAYPNSIPAAGAGKHPIIDGSGWDKAWNSFLPTSKVELETSITNCADLDTWNANPGANDELPMNCVDWYLAFAFCAWDGGRLPTETEWNYAAAGGNEQRVYPWSVPANSTTIDPTYATYGCLLTGSSVDCNIHDIAYVGWTSPKGDSLWGQADMAGNMMEWVLDWHAMSYSQSCSNCANLVTGTDRVLRGGSWFNNPPYVKTEFRTSSTPTLLDGLDVPADEIGIRCARSAL